MTIEKVPGFDEISYYLISYDKRGNERSDDPDSLTGRLSEDVISALEEESFSDVFFISHGWKGDVPAAKRQYDDWIAAMLNCTMDRQNVLSLEPNFRVLLIGLHWPSLPWGDESHSSGISFSAPGDESANNFLTDAMDKVADSDAAIEALKTIFSAALDDIRPAHLSQEVIDAYHVLYGESELQADGPGGAPGEDAETFDPERFYQIAKAEEALSFGGSGLGGVLSPLRQLSFWTMKKRAKTFGESGAASLLRRLQNVAGDTRFHLMGHSFGSIVVSATVSGAAGGSSLPRPVESLYLVQGALSLWSYASKIELADDGEGYFHDIARDHKVSGAILTTQSEHDTALSKLYSVAAGISRQVHFAPGELPKYGAVGTFGLSGPGFESENLKMPESSHPTVFNASKIYNLEASQYISEGGGLSGAHSDIAKPEVAHAFWRAIISSLST